MAGTTGFVEANGLTFAYIEEGSGPLVLMLHGFPDTAHTWDDLRPRIAAKGYRAVSPFMRGYHPSGVPAVDADQETLARDPLALISALGASEAVLIGHDWGASAAYGAAALGPDRVSKLITVAIPHPATLKPSPRKLWGARHFAAYKLPGAAKRFARNDFEALPAIYRRWSPTWSPPAEEFDAVRECFASPGSLDAAFGYYRKLSPFPSRVAEGADHGADGRLCRARRSGRRSLGLPSRCPDVLGSTTALRKFLVGTSCIGNIRRCSRSGSFGTL